MNTRWIIESHDTVTSTMDLARERVRAGAGDGLVVVAREQTAGRGRRGSRWESPSGGLWVSVVVRPDRGTASSLTVAAALAAAVACWRVTGVNVRVKWPNDLYLSDAKVGGVMGETVGALVILGVGINANVTREFVPSVEHYRTTSLRVATGAAVDLTALLDAFLEELDARAGVVGGEGLPGLVAEWRSRSAELGRRVIAERDGRTVRGRATAIQDDGSLVVETDGDTIILAPHGDVSLGLLAKGRPRAEEGT